MFAINNTIVTLYNIQQTNIGENIKNHKNCMLVLNILIFHIVCDNVKKKM